MAVFSEVLMGRKSTATLDQILDSVFSRFGMHRGWSRSVLPEQKERVLSIKQYLQALHDKLPVQESVKLAQLAYFWSGYKRDKHCRAGAA